MQIVILSAGRGVRFNGSQFHNDKPLIEWDGKTMVEHVIDNLKGDNTSITLIKRSQHDIKNLGVNVINVDYITEGPASSAYLSKNIILLKICIPQSILTNTNCL